MMVMQAKNSEQYAEHLFVKRERETGRKMTSQRSFKPNWGNRTERFHEGLFGIDIYMYFLSQLEWLQKGCHGWSSK